MKLKEYIEQLVNCGIVKMTFSKLKYKSYPYKKTVVERKSKGFQSAQYTEKQVFHKNFDSNVADNLMEIAGNYLNINAMCNDGEYIILINKKGNCMMKKTSNTAN